MSIQDDFTAAGEEYARRIDERKETTRLAALALEAQKQENATAFARAFEDALKSDNTNDTQE